MPDVRHPVCGGTGVTGTPANFVIIGYTDENGKVMMTALSNVYKVEIDQENEFTDVNSWGGSTIRRLQGDPRVSVTTEAYRGDMVQVLADDAASAWRKLFDIWVPPSADGVQ